MKEGMQDSTILTPTAPEVATHHSYFSRDWGDNILLPQAAARNYLLLRDNHDTEINFGNMKLLD